MENKLIPFQAARYINANSVLVFAPHPDDEIFGCGGAIMRHIAEGVPVHVVILTDGAFCADDAERQALAETRKAESRAAAKLLGYPEPEFWHLPDRGIEYGEALIERLMQTMDAHQDDLLVYAPSLREMHPDHRRLAMAVVEAVRRLDGHHRLAMYEVSIPLQQPNFLLDISDLLDRKQAAMSCFVSQLKLQRYDEHILALNRYRSYTLTKETVAAEAYQLVTSQELAQDPLLLYQPEYLRQHALELPQVPDDLPLVSILIRSMNRTSLREALDSVSLQTYSHIEVVVIAACGQAHPAIGASCGRFPLRLEFSSDGSSLPRAHAANLALERAKGQWLIFLDDDDTFDPDHIANLIQALYQYPQIKAVYAGVRLEDDKGQVKGSFNLPFDQKRLFASNFIPIHALLFSRSLIGEGGARFDENMDVYEDWDFWLQLSLHTSFLHVSKISATYRARGDSGVGLSANEDMQQKGREQLFDKWRLLWTGKDVNQLAQCALDLEWKLTECDNRIAGLNQALAERDNQLADLNQAMAERDSRIANLNRAVDENNEHIARLDQIIAAREYEIRQILDSTSWRLTYPLRAAKSFFTINTTTK